MSHACTIQAAVELEPAPPASSPNRPRHLVSSSDIVFPNPHRASPMCCPQESPATTQRSTAGHRRQVCRPRSASLTSAEYRRRPQPRQRPWPTAALLCESPTTTGGAYCCFASYLKVISSITQPLSAVSCRVVCILPLVSLPYFPRQPSPVPTRPTFIRVQTEPRHPHRFLSKFGVCWIKARFSAVQ